jgi:hypothetical protein
MIDIMIIQGVVQEMPGSNFPLPLPSSRPPRLVSLLSLCLGPRSMR